MKVKCIKTIIFCALFFAIIIISTTAVLTVAYSYITKANHSEEAISLNSKECKTIIIDPGHGGEDCGAIGVTGIYEKELNMQISKKLGDYLRAAGYNVIYTRTEDKLLYTEEENIKGMRKIYDLKNRTNIANSYSDAIFISIHMNSYGNENCSGLQVYHTPGNEEAKKLALNVQSSVKSTLQSNNKRTIKSGENIFLLENSANPAILIECGFISNTEECTKLSEKEYQKELCFSILCGIIEYVKQR